jgi:hypothetical protein
MAITGKAVNVTVTDYASTPDLDLSANFAPKFWRIFLTSSGGTDQVAVSFDGVNDHSQLIQKGIDEFVIEEQSRKIWLKKVAGSPAVFITAATGALS